MILWCVRVVVVVVSDTRLQWWWLAVLGCCYGRHLLLGIRVGERESDKAREMREKKI